SARYIEWGEDTEKGKAAQQSGCNLAMFVHTKNVARDPLCSWPQFGEAIGKEGFFLGGRTRARTWDPLIKSQPRVENNQRLAGRTPGLIRPKMGIRRTIIVLRCTACYPSGQNVYSRGLARYFRRHLHSLRKPPLVRDPSMRRLSSANGVAANAFSLSHSAGVGPCARSRHIGLRRRG